MPEIIKRVFLIVLALGLLAPRATPQASSGTVTGTVRDQTGAAMPAVSVSLTNIGTAVTAITATNEAGLYLFPGLQPGRYRITATAAGMQGFEGFVTVQVQQTAVLDIALKVGGVSETVEVRDVTPMLTVDSPTLGRIVERTRIEQLPINGRQLTQLLSIVPGMEESRGVIGTVGTRAFGLREGAADFLLDGASLTDPRYGGVPYRQPGLDSVEEFRIESNNSSARFSKPTSVVVSTRSGTNRFHGSLFETHRNNAIGRARTREDLSSTAPQLIRNEFGGSAGGPVRLPGLYNGRNRTFWFFAYEALRNVNATVQGASVPTEAMRNGDLRGLVDGQGRQFRIYDPWTTNMATWERQQISYHGELNVIDPARISPLAKHLIGITPLPTNPGVNPLLDRNWWGPWPATNRQWTATTRFDHNFTDNDRFFARYSQGDYAEQLQDVNMPFLDPVPGSRNTYAPNKSLALSWVRAFSPTVFNELLVSGSRQVFTQSTGEPGVRYSDMLGMPNPFGAAGWPRITSTGLTGYEFRNVNTLGTPYVYIVLDDNATRVVGKHELQFGGRLRYDQHNLLPDTQYPQGSLSFDIRATALYDTKSQKTSPMALPQTGHAFANFLLGQGNYANQLARSYFYLRSREYALYFQDNFRATSRLTLNLGLRWEYWPAYREKNGVLTSFDRERKAIVLGRELETLYRLGATVPAIVEPYRALGATFIGRQEAGLPPYLTRTPKDNFAPRLGFAYRAGDGRNAFVLRGGYRTSYFRVPAAPFVARMRLNTPLNGVFRNNPDDAASAPDGIGSWSMRSVPAIVAGRNSTTAVVPDQATGITRGSTLTSYFAENQPLSTVHDWNVTIEKELTADTALRVSLVGKHGRNLEQFYRYNETTPSYIWLATRGERPPTGAYANVATRPFDQEVYGTIEEYLMSGWSNFAGGQLELERRYGKGLAYQFFYNVGNALTAGGRSYNSVIPELNQFLPGRVPEDLHARNRFINYQRDDSVPKHRLRWNWIADLPFGRGKWLGRNAGSILDRIVGGWQIAGMGSLRSNYFSLPDSVFPNGNKIEIYGTKYPIQDCRSGTCYPGYLWWNGYIPANRINSYDTQGRPNGIMGVPASYQPAGQPLIPWPQEPNPSDPMYSFYGTNTVWIPLNNGVVERTTFNENLHPWRQQYLPGPWQWGLDASLVKSMQLGENMRLRFNADFFNVLNAPGLPSNVGANGVLSTRTSGQPARLIQLTLRVTW